MSSKAVRVRSSALCLVQILRRGTHCVVQLHVSALTVLSTFISHPVIDRVGISEGAANMVKGVANVWVPVEDIERALDFYQGTLGFSVIKQDGP